jgi:hypothetical protein
MPPIVNQENTNQSGIGVSAAKTAAMPPGWKELDGYRERWREDDMSVTRVWNGPWLGRKAFVDWLLGYSTTVADVSMDPENTTYKLSRTLPAQHPEYPWLFASEVEDLSGVGAWDEIAWLCRDRNGDPILDENGEIGDFVFAPSIRYYDSSSMSSAHSCTLRVVYRHRDYELREDADAWERDEGELSRYVSRFFRVAILHLQLASLSTLLKFTEGPHENTEIPEAGVKLFPTVQLTMVWNQVPDVPWDAINACTGHVNAETFDGAPGYRSYPPGTLLCQAPEVKRLKSIVGRVIWEIIYRFDYRGSVLAADGTPATWNHFPAGDGQLYKAAFPAAVPVYPSADFDSLFVAPAPVDYQ